MPFYIINPSFANDVQFFQCCWAAELRHPMDQDQELLLSCLVATLDTNQDVRSLAEASLQEATLRPGLHFLSSYNSSISSPTRVPFLLALCFFCGQKSFYNSIFYYVFFFIFMIRPSTLYVFFFKRTLFMLSVVSMSLKHPFEASTLFLFDFLK